MSIKFNNEPNGKLSFVQEGRLFERELFTEGYYLYHLLALLDEAIVANCGDNVELYSLYFSDAEQVAFVLMSATHQQMIEQQALLMFKS